MENEIAELLDLADVLGDRAHAHRRQFQDLLANTMAHLDSAASPLEVERLSEKFARALRHLWIEASVSITSLNYRSPPAEKKTRTATGRNIEFGYERDLHPNYLEERCNRFFEQPPEPWTADHVLLSSGQAAM